MRVKRGTVRRQKAKKIRKQTKGMQHSRRANLKLGRQAVIRSLQYAYRDRRNRKRDFRSLWITRINAAARINDTTYSKLISGMKKHNIQIDRKILSDLAVKEPEAFKEVVKAALTSGKTEKK